MKQIPISKAIRDTRDKIAEVLNNSGLPIDVMDLLMGEIKLSIHQQAEQMYLTEIEKKEENDVHSN